jgi:hypothetical protein
MIQLEKTLISDDIFEKKFVCDLNACKGACCVEGESGAPLEEVELDILEKIYDQVKPYMRKDGVEAVEEQGHFVLDWDGEFTTPLVNGAECAYVSFDDDGTAKCAIEQAYRDGIVDWPKPISCHLYPIRITKLKDFDALNYHKWKICEPACSCGSELDVRVYKFLKQPLIRKYGEEWYAQLEAAFEFWSKQQ